MGIGSHLTNSHTEHTGKDGVAKRSRRTRATHEVPMARGKQRDERKYLPQDLIDGRPPLPAGTEKTWDFAAH